MLFWSAEASGSGVSPGGSIDAVMCDEVAVVAGGVRQLVVLAWVCVGDTRLSNIAARGALGVVAVAAVPGQVNTRALGEVFLVFLVKMELVIVSEVLAAAVLLVLHDTREYWRGGVLEAGRLAAAGGERLVTSWYSGSPLPG